MYRRSLWLIEKVKIAVTSVAVVIFLLARIAYMAVMQFVQQ
ncbi:hypothetical protein ACE1TF_07070 [Geomicrobium sp. JSM 1781026]